MVERLASDIHSSLMDPFISYKEMKCCEYIPWYLIGLLSGRLFLCSLRLDRPG
jgi:hypothetical protein